MNTDLVNVADVAERQSGRECRRCIGSQVKRGGSTTDVVERRVWGRLAHKRHWAKPEALQVARETVEQLDRVQETLPVELQLLARLFVKITLSNIKLNDSAIKQMNGCSNIRVTIEQSDAEKCAYVAYFSVVRFDALVEVLAQFFGLRDGLEGERVLCAHFGHGERNRRRVPRVHSGVAVVAAHRSEREETRRLLQHRPCLDQLDSHRTPRVWRFRRGSTVRHFIDGGVGPERNNGFT